MHHAVDASPVGQSAQIAVIDKEIGFYFARKTGVCDVFFRIVPVDGIEFHTPFPAPFHGFLQKLPFTYRPQNQPVALVHQHLQRSGGKGNLFSYPGIAVLYDGTVKINGYGHK